MSRKYKFKDQSKAYFVSFAVVNWIDLFVRNEYRDCLIESLKHCQKEKGLVLYGWVIMPSHVHLIIGSEKDPMQNILRDFKSYTSRKLKELIENNPKESRREWLLWMFKRAGIKNSNNNEWQLWQQDNHPIELFENSMVDQKLEYLHNNPVESGFVSDANDYIWSSARTYSGENGILEIVKII